MRRSQDGEGLEMNAPEAAQSVVRAFGHAMGSVVELDDMDPAEQDRWVRAVRSAFEWMPVMDGKPVAEAVALFVADYAGDDAALKAAQTPYLRAWEAAVRHLCALLDTDELEDEADVRALEASWADWASSRKPRVEVS